ncbi:MAG: tetratricopeptide repeat protein [Flavobacteriales bacterium]|nr:tetratricopeptide repeat protein [Flavobacteriales bacterium]PCH89439.1 MAG: hypothetical protein COB88_01115 [Flavobacteriales bacterium]
MKRYIYVLFLVILIIAPAAGQKGNEFKEFYYPPASKLFDARHYFKTLQYYNDELAMMKLKSAKDSADMANVYYLRGRCKFELTDKRGAMEDLTVAIELFSRQESFYYYRGLANHWLKRYAEAMADYDKAIKLNPRKMSYYLNRGFVKYLSGDLDAACYDFSKAGENGSFEVYEVIKEYCN